MRVSSKLVSVSGEASTLNVKEELYTTAIPLEPILPEIFESVTVKVLPETSSIYVPAGTYPSTLSTSTSLSEPLPSTRTAPMPSRVTTATLSVVPYASATPLAALWKWLTAAISGEVKCMLPLSPAIIWSGTETFGRDKYSADEPTRAAATAYALSMTFWSTPLDSESFLFA